MNVHEIRNEVRDLITKFLDYTHKSLPFKLGVTLIPQFDKAIEQTFWLGVQPALNRSHYVFITEKLEEFLD